MFHRNNSTARGFSMIEIAIVLAVIGAVLAGLWAAAATVYEYSRREQAREAITTTVANVRGFFSGQIGVSALAYAALTNQLLSENVIPSSLKRPSGCSGNLCADNPWGANAGGSLDTNGTYRVCNWDINNSTDCSYTSGTTSAFFGIEMTGLQQKTCIGMVQNMSSATMPTGLVEINVNGTNLLKSGYAIQPVADNVTITQCKTATDGNGKVTFVYRISAQTI